MAALNTRVLSGDSLFPGRIVAGGVLACIAAAVACVAVVQLPTEAIVPLVAFAGAFLPVNAKFRLTFLVLGGLAILQSSQEFNPIKIAYLLGAGVALAAALVNLRGTGANTSDSLYRPFLILSFLFFALVGLSFAVAIVHGTSMTAWLRDAAPYFLFASVPVFVLDVHSSASRKLLVFMFVVAGTLAAVSFCIEWLDRRHLADPPIARLGLPSFWLAAAVFSYAVSGALQGRSNQAGWTVLSASIFSLLLVTGTRSTFVLLAAPLAMALAGRADLLRRSLRLVLFGCAFVPLVLVFTQSLSMLTGADTGILAGRHASIGRVLGDPAQDRSFHERATQTRLAWRTFLSEPVLGTGPGHLFEWTTGSGTHQARFKIDTALSFLSKFGVVGVTVLVVVAIGLASSFASLSGEAGSRVARCALLGYAAILLLGLPLGTPLEDKGLSFGLLFLLALSLSGERARQPQGVAGPQ